MARDPDTKWINDFMRQHPVTRRTDLSPKEAADIFLRDAKAANPKLMERWAHEYAIKRLTRVVDAVKSGNENRARRMLRGMGKQHVDDLLQKIHALINRDEPPPRRKRVWVN